MNQQANEVAYEDAELAAEALSADILEIMKHYGQAHRKIVESGFTENVQNKAVRLSRTLYLLMLQEVGSQFRAKADASIQAEFNQLTPAVEENP